jgi:hypothetical protein
MKRRRKNSLEGNGDPLGTVGDCNSRRVAFDWGKWSQLPALEPRTDVSEDAAGPAIATMEPSPEPATEPTTAAVVPLAEAFDTAPKPRRTERWTEAEERCCTRCRRCGGPIVWGEVDRVFDNEHPEGRPRRAAKRRWIPLDPDFAPHGCGGPDAGRFVDDAPDPETDANEWRMNQ